MVNANTLEVMREYTDLGIDILDIYSIDNGNLMGNLSSINPAVLDEKGAGSQKIYEYSGVIELIQYQPMSFRHG